MMAERVGSKYYFSDESHVYGGSLGSSTVGFSMRRSFSLPRWMDTMGAHLHAYNQGDSHRFYFFYYTGFPNTETSKVISQPTLLSPYKQAAVAAHPQLLKGKLLGLNGLLQRGRIRGRALIHKELLLILQERSDAEAAYAKSLSKLSGRLLRATRDHGQASSSVNNAWHFIGEDMETTAEVHRSLASVLSEECVKPLKSFAEAQHRSRKSLESSVDKRARAHGDSRNYEAKAKSKSYSVCRDNERVQDVALDCKLGRGKNLSEKELSKLHLKRKKAEEATRKCDAEYYTSCLKAERSR
ncbi:Uncharacterized protein FKW44_019375 [Caligus rogercresseyi]|uniref:F-BAR domain-containing protein n=1 Tax=Caligus rogercresseyi TaxID=217165 RepID=A0A7T8GW92_CALRO|nr:Uncharacterized protein FKW44_019375 [Caligus rogercresseyi]